jgi:hypothetical protein
MPLPAVRSRPGLNEFSLGLNPFTAAFQLALDEIGPMTRNPERDTERSRVVRARGPSLSTGMVRRYLNISYDLAFDSRELVLRRVGTWWQRITDCSQYFVLDTVGVQPGVRHIFEDIDWLSKQFRECRHSWITAGSSETLKKY